MKPFDKPTKLKGSETETIIALFTSYPTVPTVQGESRIQFKEEEQVRTSITTFIHSSIHHLDTSVIKSKEKFYYKIFELLLIINNNIIGK
ncbi:CLUMA_CG004715, isoform A [Clunio marinus]|uniref:CLUMA_CG004715, isoform A n=1 Tax=Clunio marinus TaxID=568069 RepID=A0A1J1HSQ9_9DIPT|nr:CLUMA_CG004715, isoform A [Clunio marinus]